MIVEITTFCLQYIIVSGSAKYCQFGRQTHWLIKKESALFWRLMYPFAMHHGGFCETHHLQKAFSHHSSEILSEYWCTALPHSSPLSPLQEGAYAYTPHQSISGCTQSPPSLLPKVLQQGSTMHIANVQFKYMFILPLPKGIEISWDWRGGDFVGPNKIKKCMKLNWNFQRSGVIPPMGEAWILSRTTQCR